MKAILLASSVLFVLTSSCTQLTPEDQEFEVFADSYIERLLELEPEWATELGNHRYDDRLGDYTRRGFEDKLAFNREVLQSLKGINLAKLQKVNKVDYQILKHNVERIVFSLETLREYEWNPLVYNTGRAFYPLMWRDFAPLTERLVDLKGRLKQLPDVLLAARANLENPPRIHTETAIAQNRGLIRLVGAELDSLLKSAGELEEGFDSVQRRALLALEEYGEWLERDLLPRSEGDFRIGGEKFRRKLFYTLDSRVAMEEILEKAQADITEIQEDMYLIAAPIYERYFPNQPTRERPRGKQRVIASVLAKLAESHPTNEKVVESVRESLERCRRFVAEHRLVSIPKQPIKLIVMPEFSRGVAVAYCDAPGPLEQHGETFLAISPAPSDWSEDKIESFFREYNFYMLEDLTFHEAMPGHFLQLAHAKKFQAPTKVRAVFSSGPFIEGWATYAEQIMVEAGYGGPEVKLQQLRCASGWR